MDIPPEELRQVVTAALASYRQHRDWEDLIQEGWLAAWQQCERLEGQAAWTTIAWKAARWRAGQALREPGMRAWLGPARPQPGARVFAVGALTDGWRDGEPGRLEPGYAAIERRLDAARQWQAVRAGCNERQWEAIRLHVREGLSLAETGRVLGISSVAVHTRVLRGLRPKPAEATRERMSRSQKARRQREKQARSLFR